MSKKVEFEDYEYSTGGGWSYWSYDDQGQITTPYGVVDVVKCESFKCDPGWTSLQYINSGMVYSRYYNKCYSKQYCATLAKRFSKEIAYNNAA